MLMPTELMLHIHSIMCTGRFKHKSTSSCIEKSDPSS